MLAVFFIQFKINNIKINNSIKIYKILIELTYMNYDTKIKVVVVVYKNNKILLIKEKIKKFSDPKWNIIRGSYDKEGESIMETAIREALEESKVSIKLTNYIGTFTQRSSDKLRIYYAFNAKTEDDPIVPEEETQKQNDEFISEVGWFSEEEISKIDPEKMIDPIVYDILNTSIKGKSYPLVDFYDKKV